MLDKVKSEGIIGKLLYNYSDKIFEDKSNLLHVFIEKKKNTIEGFIWSSISILDLALSVQLFHVNSKHKKEVLGMIKEKLLETKKELKLKNVFWTTTKHQELEKIGFIESDRIIMELKNEELKEA